MSTTRPTSRRTLLGASATLAAVATLLGTTKPSSALSAGPDAELLRLLAEFDAAERDMVDHHHGGSRYIASDKERERAVEPFQKRQDELLGPICAARATTAEGIVARLRTLALYVPDQAEASEDGYVDDRLLAAALRDAMELGA